MSRVYLKTGNQECIFYTEMLGCADKDMIMVRNACNEKYIIPKANIAYIEE